MIEVVGMLVMAEQDSMNFAQPIARESRRLEFGASRSKSKAVALSGWVQHRIGQQSDAAHLEQHARSPKVSHVDFHRVPPSAEHTGPFRPAADDSRAREARRPPGTTNGTLFSSV